MKEAGNVFLHSSREKAAGTLGLGRVQLYRPRDFQFSVFQFSRLDKDNLTVHFKLVNKLVLYMSDSEKQMASRPGMR